jgi:hypothetical protein
MEFSLTYAFGKMGRHIRKISREARQFVGPRFRLLEVTPVRDFLFAEYLGIDTTIFAAFYTEDTADIAYSVHKKYANKLLDATEADFRHLARAYAFGLLASQPIVNGTDEETIFRQNLLESLGFIYDGTKPADPWPAVVFRPSGDVIAAAVCMDIAAALQLNPRDKGEFSRDWLSLTSRMIAVRDHFLAQADWSKSAASMINSVDFGGPNT